MQEISKVLADKYDEVVEKINVFSGEYLNQEYTTLCNKGAKELFLNCESNVKKGKSISWAAGIVHAIGSVNNLFDSKEEPYVKAQDLYKAFGVSSSTGSSKSKEVKSLLDINEENSKWIINIDNSSITTGEEEAALTVDKDDEEELKFLVSKNYVEAQKLVNTAWQERNFKNKVKVAKQAIEIYEDCSDAYIILANDSSLTKAQRIELLERAVKAGQNVLKIEKLEEADKRVFDLIIAEPFFGAKYALAVYLWDNNEREAAIKHAFDIITYDRYDKLLVRGLLTSWLLIEEKYEDAKVLLAKYEKDSLASINYNRAALVYKTGTSKEAESALRRAYIRNPFVVDYLLKRKNVKNNVTGMANIGSEEEARVYARLGLQVWNDPKMLSWLKEMKKDFDILNLR